MATSLQYISRAVSGVGNPTNGDRLVREVTTFRVNHLYVNKTDGSVWIRKATNGVAADWETMEPGVGGGGGLVLSETITLTDAQIKALPSTSIQITPAPGVGKMVMFMGATLRMNWVADYTNITPIATILLQLGLSGSIALAYLDNAQNEVSDLLAFGGDVVFHPLNAGFTVWDDPGQYENKPIAIRGANTGAGNDFTGGNAGNSLKVTVLYAVIDL